MNKIRKFSKRISPNGGASLVEIIVALVIIAMVSLVMISAFGAGSGVMKRSVIRRETADESYTKLESTSANTGSNAASFKVSGETKTYTVKGQLLEESTTKDDITVTFRAFDVLGKAE